MTAHRAYAVRWKDSPRWDIKSARATLFRLANPSFRPLSEFAEEATELVHPASQPDHEWPVYGVNNTEGVFLSHYQIGRTFNAAYKRIRRDWFFHNPTRANVGSLGRVPDVLEDAITSPEYQVWRLREGLIPDYVAILIRTRFFLDLIDFHRVGAVKQRLFVSNLLEIPVPVLTEDAQRSLVAVWNETQAEIAKTCRRTAAIEEKIEADFLTELGLSRPGPTDLPKCFAVHWHDFRRWSLLFNQLVTAGMDVAAGKYPALPLDQALSYIQYGSSTKANTQRRGTAIIRMNNIVDGELSLSDLKHVELPERERQSLLLQDGDILINRTNSKELVGKCAVFHEQADYVFASYLIRLRANAEIADPDYLAFAINSTVGRQQVNMLSRQIAGQANINTEEIRSIEIPMPPPAVQRRMVRKISAGREKITTLKAEAKQKAELACADVEAMILSGRRDVFGDKGGQLTTARHASPPA